jgi:hypothetical protein
MNRSEILTQVRSKQNLNDSAKSTWTDVQLNLILEDVLNEIAEKRALRDTVILPITEYTKDVDISSLSRLIKIYQVEWPVESEPFLPPFRRFTQFGNSRITLDVNSRIEIRHRTTSGESSSTGTLTGTVTFTKGSRTVTGSSTLFTTELQSNYDSTYGDLIGVSTGSRYYQVAHCDSATSLTLDEPFEEETVTDTASATLSRTHKGCVKIHYGKKYTVTRSEVISYCSGLDDITVGTNYTGTSVINYKVKIDSTGTPDQFKWSADGGTTYSAATNCATTATALSNGVTVLWAATTGHTDEDYWTFTCAPTDLEGVIETCLIKGITAYAALQHGTYLTDVETTLDQIDTDLTAGRAVINSLNIGGDVAGKYTDMGKVGVAEAEQRNFKIKQYKAWADLKYGQYQIALHKLYRASDHVIYNCSRVG